LLQRLTDLAAGAKRSGGNRTYTDDGSRATVVPPADKTLAQRKVTLE
jgi:hypothetical protein